MNGSDSSTCEHRNGEFRNHWHVQGDSITSLHTQLLEYVCKFANFAMEVLVAKNSRISRFAFPDDRRFVARRTVQMAIDAVIAGIDFATDKPLCVRHMSLNDGVPLAEPFQVSCHLTPESRRIILGSMPHRLILLFTADVSICRKCGWRCKRSSFLQNALNALTSRLRHLSICSWAIIGVVGRGGSGPQTKRKVWQILPTASVGSFPVVAAFCGRFMRLSTRPPRFTRMLSKCCASVDTFVNNSCTFCLAGSVRLPIPQGVFKRATASLLTIGFPSGIFCSSALVRSVPLLTKLTMAKNRLSNIGRIRQMVVGVLIFPPSHC